jgi:hypothetical protein
MAAPMPDFLGLKHSVNYTITEVRRPRQDSPPFSLYRLSLFHVTLAG